ncbi:MAG: hypothetical protein GOP50_03830 [Candidatus Heimdallarchaeota archaeon]|nr:hypothetical protein [Candidatus Heimdallarchaeota archaeon]
MNIGTDVVVSNPLGVIYESAGGLLPENNTELQMIEASVVMEINETYGNIGTFGIIFDGNYTIYNPNETIEILIGAPFLTIYEGLSDSLLIEVEGSEKEFDIVYYDYHNNTANSWMDYFSLYITESRYFALCNVTFAGFSNTTIRYRFNSTTSFTDGSALYITYDVGTARAWNSSITETVEFRVIGEQPTDFTDFTEEGYANLTVTEISRGQSYLWSWVEVELMMVPFVDIEYMPEYFERYSNEASGFWFLPSIGFLMVIVILYRSNKKKQ